MPPNKLCCDQHWKDLPAPLQNGLFLAWLDNDWELLQTLHRELKDASARNRPGQ